MQLAVLMRWAGGVLVIALVTVLVYRPHTLQGKPTAPPLPPQRVVSLTLAADEILLALVPPTRIAALTRLADNPLYSNVVTEARQVRHKVHANAEQVIALQPDLVVVSASADTGGTAKALLHQIGIPLLRLKWYDSIAGIQQNILAVGQALGATDRARLLVAEMEQRLHAVQQRVAGAPRPGVLYYALDGFTTGSRTTIDEIITGAGGRNLPAEAGIQGFKKLSHETFVMLDPAIILISRDQEGTQSEGLQEWLLADPSLRPIRAIRHRQIYAIPRPSIDSLSHHIVTCVETVARVLHPDAFGETPVSVDEQT